MVALHAKQHNTDALVLGGFGCAQADSSTTAIGIHEYVALLQVHAVNRELIEQLGLLRVGLVERGGEISNSQPSSWSRMHSAPYTMRVSSPRMALPGRPLMFWATVTMCGLKCGDSLKELLRMRQVALSGHERNHDWSVRQPQRTTA